MKNKVLKYFVIYFISLILSNNIWSQNDYNPNAITLVDFLPSSCDDKYIVEAIRKRISHIDTKSDTTIIKVAIIENCSYDMDEVFGEIKFQNDTLYLNFLRAEEIKKKESTEPYFVSWAACDCCFEFQYWITGLKRGNIPPIKLKGDYVKYHPSKFNDRFFDIPVDSVIQSDSLNYIDYSGNRQGKWIWSQNGRLKADFEYLDNEIIQGEWSDYFPNGVTKETYNWYKQDSVIFRKYSNNGILIEKHSVKFHDNGFGEYEVIFSKEEIDSIITKHNNAYSK